MPPTAVPTPPAGSPPRRSRALVIDGHAAVRSTFALALATIGCDAATARDGQEALALVRETLQTDAIEDDRPRPFELVIMDLVLPRTDGATLLGQLRKEFPGMPPTVVLGSLQDPAAIEALIELGAADYVPKPFDLDVVLYKACTLLGEPAQAPFHWAPLGEGPPVHVAGLAASATAVSETGLVVALPTARVHRRQPVAIDCASLEATLGLRRCRGRIVNVTQIGGQDVVEVAFVALSEAESHRLRRFTVAR